MQLETNARGQTSRSCTAPILMASLCILKKKKKKMGIAREFVFVDICSICPIVRLYISFVVMVMVMLLLLMMLLLLPFLLCSLILLKFNDVSSYPWIILSYRSLDDVIAAINLPLITDREYFHALFFISIIST